MNNELLLYHGSPGILEKPEYGVGRKHNDYGIGFYCTESEALAGEWACTSLHSGYINRYALDTSILNILYLNSEEYSILNWMAVLVEYRVFNTDVPLARRAKKYLHDNFLINVNAYDVIIGYRADDAYYDFANAFLNNTITVEQLDRALVLGKLGEQIVLKSKLAFDSIRFLGFDEADRDRYYPVKKVRTEQAGRDFQKICEEDADGLYMIDIMRAGLTNADARIPRSKPVQMSKNKGVSQDGQDL